MGNTLSPVVMKQLIKGLLFMDNETTTHNSNRIIIHRNISSKYSMNYLNLKEEVAEKYLEFIKNGGEVIIKINKYDSVQDKKNNTNKETYFIKITDLEQLGYASRKYNTRRYKIVGKVKKDNYIAQGYIRPEDIKNKVMLNDYKTQIFNNASTLGSKRKTIISAINHKNKMVEKQLLMMKKVKNASLKHSNNLLPSVQELKIAQ